MERTEYEKRVRALVEETVPGYPERLRQNYFHMVMAGYDAGQQDGFAEGFKCGQKIMADTIDLASKTMQR